MTSPREAVSLLTAAALVVAPVGGVAATYTTGYAEDGGDSLTTTAEGRTLPKSYDEALRWLDAGKLYKSTVQVMKAHADQLDLTATQFDELEVQALEDGPVSEEPVPAEEAQKEPEQPQTEETPAPSDPAPTEPGAENPPADENGEETGDADEGGSSDQKPGEDPQGKPW